MAWKAWVVACGGAMALAVLSGCAPEKVRDVVVDKGAYLGKHFGVDSLPAQVRETVENADHAPLPFQQMVVDITWKYHDVVQDTSYTVDSTSTLTNVGGSFVQALREYTRNGVPTGQLFEISYRGLQALRDQDVANDKRMVDPLYEIKSLKHFDVLAPGDSGSKVEYEFAFAPSVQIMNFPIGRNSCVLGSVTAASQLSPALEGNEQQVDCTEYNSNGVVRGHIRYAYLTRYGVALELHSESASKTKDGTVTRASVH